MKSIRKYAYNELIINKSKFIAYLYPIHQMSDVNTYLEKARKEYRDATHVCYAYILDNVEKCSDDGEPSKTAGAPLLHVLEMNELNHILCIVVRYFGGIKLGAGGLLRAYTKSITECLKKIKVELLEEGCMVQIEFTHSNSKQVDYILKEYSSIKKYDSNILYQFRIATKDVEEIKKQLLPYILHFEIIGTTFV